MGCEGFENQPKALAFAFHDLSQWPGGLYCLVWVFFLVFKHWVCYYEWLQYMSASSSSYLDCVMQRNLFKKSACPKAINILLLSDTLFKCLLDIFIMHKASRKRYFVLNVSGPPSRLSKQQIITAISIGLECHGRIYCMLQMYFSERASKWFCPCTTLWNTKHLALKNTNVLQRDRR